MKDVSSGLSTSVLPDSIVPQLERWLRDASDQIGSAAAKALATLGQPGRNALFTALEDIDSRAIYRAIVALRESDDPQFVAAAMRLLRDENPDVRAGAVEALGATKTIAALEAIIGALGDPHGMVCRVAIESLGQFEDSSLAREQLLSFLGDDSDVFCKAAAESLVRHGVKALEPLLDILASESVGKARRWAAYALGRIRDVRVVNPLIEALGSDDSALRAAVVESLGHIGDKGAFDAVLSALHDPDRGVRLRAATALGAIGDGRAFELLLAYLAEPDKGMARFAAAGLGKLSDVRAINPLLDTIREGWLLDSAQALGEISHDNPDAIPYLLAALEDEHMEVRASALDALSVVGAAAAFEPALRAFHRAEDETRWRALQALDRIDPERALPYLISALADPHPDTRLTATQILGWHGEHGETRAIEPLIHVLEDVDSNVQIFAADSLGWIGDSRALSALKRLRDTYADEIEPSDIAERLTSPHGSSRGILGLTTAHPASWASLTPSCRGPKPPPPASISAGPAVCGQDRT